MRAGDPDIPTFIDCNTARMTIGDLRHWLLHLHTNEQQSRALVSDSVARPVLVLLGYVPANPRGGTTRRATTTTTTSPGSTAVASARLPGVEIANQWWIRW